MHVMIIRKSRDFFLKSFLIYCRDHFFCCNSLIHDDPCHQRVDSISTASTDYLLGHGALSTTSTTSSDDVPDNVSGFSSGFAH